MRGSGKKSVLSFPNSLIKPADDVSWNHNYTHIFEVSFSSYLENGKPYMKYLSNIPQGLTVCLCLYLMGNVFIHLDGCWDGWCTFVEERDSFMFRTAQILSLFLNILLGVTQDNKRRIRITEQIIKTAVHAELISTKLWFIVYIQEYVLWD